MKIQSVTVNCPSCGVSKEVPADKLPQRPLKVTCHGCGYSFQLTTHLKTGVTQPPAAQPLPGAHVDQAAPGPALEIYPRSSFVTVLAWIFIVLAGFTTFISILQNIMINTMFPVEKMQEASKAAPAGAMPALFRFMFQHVQLYFLLVLLVSAFTLIAAIALLKRKNWARIVFIGLMACGILWNIAGLILQQSFMESMPKVPAQAPAQFAQQFESMMTVMRLATAVMAVGMSVLFGWIAKRLISPAVQAEFLPEPRKASREEGGL